MPGSTHPFLFANSPPVTGETTASDLHVDGILPITLSGRYLGIGPNPLGDASSEPMWGVADSMVHAVTLHAGRAPSYRNRWINTDATSAKLETGPVGGPAPPASDAPTTNLIVFGGRILSLADGALAHELSPDLGTVRSVDLAGHARGVGAYPKMDPLTGELHLISSPGDPTALHHVISAGGMTRRTRTIPDAPAPIIDLAITRDRLLLFGEGCIGITDRYHDEAIRWLSAGPMRSGHIIDAHDDNDRVVVHVAGQRLEEWAVTRAADVVRRTPLHATPQTLVRINERFAGSPPRYLYGLDDDCATPFGGTTLSKHDLVASTREDRVFGDGQQAGEFMFVVDPERNLDEDGGWLLGLVHDQAATRTSLVVLDAADVAGPVVASVHLPRPIPYGLHGLWIPSAA